MFCIDCLFLMSKALGFKKQGNTFCRSLTLELLLDLAVELVSPRSAHGCFCQGLALFLKLRRPSLATIFLNADEPSSSPH